MTATKKKKTPGKKSPPKSNGHAKKSRPDSVNLAAHLVNLYGKNTGSLANVGKGFDTISKPDADCMAAARVLHKALEDYLNTKAREELARVEGILADCGAPKALLEGVQEFTDAVAGSAGE